MKVPEIIQDLSWFISELIYGLIPDVYGIFEFFAKEEFFTLTELKNLWNNLYIVMSVLVLFAIGIKLISAIVNPEALDGKDTPKKKSARSAFIDAIVAVFLIILVPMGFSVLNTLQKEMIDSKFIQKYIFGITFTDESNTSVGQILAYQTLSSFLYPCDETDSKCDHEKGVQQMNAVSWEIDHMYNYISNEDLASDGINDGGVHKNTLKYHTLLAPIAGGMVLYQVILMALDMALRTVKIALLELMLPIILGAFIFNREILGRWVKEFIATYLSAFLKLMAVTMMVLGLSRINPMFDKFAADSEMVNSQVSLGLLRLILVMGILRLVKEVPNLINKIFGTNIQLQGGIRGRLGQMAGVGNLAQRAWDTLRTHPIQTARRTIAAPLSAAGSFVSSRFSAGQNAAAKFRAARNPNLSAAERQRLTRSGIGSLVGGHFGAFTAAGRGLRSGWTNANLQSIGGEYQRFQDLHPRDASLAGTLGERIRMGTGFRDSIAQEAEDDKVVNFRDRAGTTVRRVTLEQLQREQNQMNEALARRDAIFSAAEKEVERADSNVRVRIRAGANHYVGSYAQVREQIDTLRANGGITEADAATALRNLEIERQNAIHDVCTTVLSGGTAMTGTRRLAGTTGDIHGPTLGTIQTNRDVLNQSLADLITGANLVDNTGAPLAVGDVNNWANLDALNVSLWRNTNDINFNLQLHQQEIANRNNTDAHRTTEANVSAANAYRNANRNNGGGNGGGGH